MAADVERRALGMIDPRDLPFFDEPSIGDVVADRISGWLTWAERELKPAWMTGVDESEANRNTDGPSTVNPSPRDEPASFMRGNQESSRPQAETPVNELGEKPDVPAPVDQHIYEVGGSAMGLDRTLSLIASLGA